MTTPTPTHRRRTRILATLGPATDPPGVLDALLQAGVDVVRLNFSHGDPAGQQARAQAVREAAQRAGVEVGILADLPGPKLRIERFAEGRVQLKAGDTFDLVARADAPPGTAREEPAAFGEVAGRIGEQRRKRARIVRVRCAQARPAPAQQRECIAGRGHGNRMQRHGRSASVW